MKSFVNFPYIKFSKAKLHNWAKKKYITSENKKQDRVESSFLKFATLYATQKDKQAKFLDKIYDFDPVSSTLYNLIKVFTYKKVDSVSIDYLIESLALVGVNVKIINNELVIESEDLNFKVSKFSELEPEILKKLSNIEEPTRGGRCHPYGVITALYYNKCKDFETYLVTGRIYQLSPEAKYLHSWVEISTDKGVFVIDPTRNAVYPKEAFYSINHVGKTARLSSDEVKKDYDMIRMLTDYDNYAVKVYYENPERGRKLYKKLVSLGEIEEISEIQK